MEYLKIFNKIYRYIFRDNKTVYNIGDTLYKESLNEVSFGKVAEKPASIECNGYKITYYQSINNQQSCSVYHDKIFNNFGVYITGSNDPIFSSKDEKEAYTWARNWCDL